MHTRNLPHNARSIVVRRVRWFIREWMIGWHQGHKERARRDAIRHELAENKWRCREVQTTVAPPVVRVHDHPPYRPPCNERDAHGQLRGACLNDDGTSVTTPAGGHKSTRRADTSQPTRDTAPRGR